MSESTQQRNSEATREKILNAAHCLFVADGFNKVSMRQIAQASGVTKSLIHHHFLSKEGVWEAVKYRRFSQYVVVQSELLANNSADSDLIKDSIVVWFDFLKTNPDVVRLFAWAHLEGDKSCGKLDRELIGSSVEKIREAQKLGHIRDDINPLHLLVTFIAATTQWFESRVHYANWFPNHLEGDDDDDKFLSDFLTIFIEGIQAR